MCRDIMETQSRFFKAGYLRPGGGQTSYVLQRVSTNRSSEPCCCSPNAYRKHCRRERRRARKAKLGALAIETGKKGKSESGCNTQQADCCCFPPVGAMAPNNTTQYLMRNVYEDQKIDEALPLPHETPAHLYSEALSPRSVSAALDSYFDGILAFQIRDFEELYGPTWNPE